MSHQFHSLKYCNQQDRDIVNGYVKGIQSILPHEQNSFFIIDKLILKLILLYFHKIFESKILTDDEQLKLLELLQQHTKDKFRSLLLSKSFNLIYEASKAKADKTEFIDKVYDRENILLLIETANDNVIGGYTCKGWNKSLEPGQGVIDDDVFVFGIRSSQEYEPQISYVKQNDGKETLHHTHSWIFLFGNEMGQVIFGIHKDGAVCAYSPEERLSFTEGDYLFGSTVVEEVQMNHLEVFEMIRLF